MPCMIGHKKAINYNTDILTLSLRQKNKNFVLLELLSLLVCSLLHYYLCCIFFLLMLAARVGEIKFIYYTTLYTIHYYTVNSFKRCWIAAILIRTFIHHEGRINEGICIILCFPPFCHMVHAMHPTDSFFKTPAKIKQDREVRLRLPELQ